MENGTSTITLGSASHYRTWPAGQILNDLMNEPASKKSKSNSCVPSSLRLGKISRKSLPDTACTDLTDLTSLLVGNLDPGKLKSAKSQIFNKIFRNEKNSLTMAARSFLENLRVKSDSINNKRRVSSSTIDVYLNRALRFIRFTERAGIDFNVQSIKQYFQAWKKIYNDACFEKEKAFKNQKNNKFSIRGYKLTEGLEEFLFDNLIPAKVRSTIKRTSFEPFSKPEHSRTLTPPPVTLPPTAALLPTEVTQQVAPRSRVFRSVDTEQPVVFHASSPELTLQNYDFQHTPEEWLLERFCTSMIDPAHSREVDPAWMDELLSAYQVSADADTPSALKNLLADSW